MQRERGFQSLCWPPLQLKTLASLIFVGAFERFSHDTAPICNLRGKVNQSSVFKPCWHAVGQGGGLASSSFPASHSAMREPTVPIDAPA